MPKLNETKEEARLRRSAFRQRRKQKMVDSMGGCCQICGYNKEGGAFDFHHLDPEEKEIAVSNNGRGTSWKRIAAELRKCILLCANCHREVHSGVSEIPDEYKSFNEDFADEGKEKSGKYTCKCGAGKSFYSQQCAACEGKDRAKIVWPNTDELKERLKTTSYRALARELGVSDNAIRKRLRDHKDD